MTTNNRSRGWKNLVAVVACFGLGCSAAGGGDDFESDPTGRAGDYDPEPGEVAPSGQALTGSFDGTVSQAASSSGCTTTLVSGLSTQIVEAFNCLHPGAVARVPDKSNLARGSAVFPYLQTPARDALVKALDANPSTTLHVSSMLRTVAQQYLLYNWYKNSRCGVGLAARPGKSNHESGLALDTGDYGSWKSSLKGKGFTWFGSSDAVHFDFSGGKTINLKGEDVRAFQKLWNANNPNDQIDDDGAYGPDTEKRLRAAPAGGWPGGVDCSAITGAAQAAPASEPGKGDDPGSAGAAGSSGTEGCGAISYEGQCDGDIVKYCDNGAVKAIDCSTNGGSCAFASDKGYYDCVAASGGTGGSSGDQGTGGSSGGTGGSSGGSSSDCGSVGYEGECSGDVLRYCDNGNLTTVDCSDQGRQCSFNSQAGFYDCVVADSASGGSAGGSGDPPATDECGTVTTEGECSGDVLSYCSSGSLVTMDCATSGQTCGWDDANYYFNCL